MENHPIPQNVTGFQFKLIGNMTIKQFLYLASGCVISWICYALPFPIFAKIPLVIVPASLGFSFAFVPIEGRPFDAMLSLFVHALFAPDQYVYGKIGKPIDIYVPIPKKTTARSQINQQQISQMVQTITKKKIEKPKTKLDEKEELFIKTVLASPILVNTKPASTPPPQIISMNPVSGSTFASQTPTPEQAPQPKKDTPIHIDKENPEELEKELEKESEYLKKELDQAKEEETATHTVVAHQKTEELQKQLEEILAQKKQLEEELIALKARFEAQKPRGRRLGPSTNTPKPISSYAPEVPNLITGVIKDPTRNLLPTLLIDIQDQEGNPVRAFKTNVIGQFASATPLPNGRYKITFEDASGRHTFDPAELSATGEIIPPLEIVAIDHRNELKKQLFGT